MNKNRQETNSTNITKQNSQGNNENRSPKKTDKQDLITERNDSQVQVNRFFKNKQNNQVEEKKKDGDVINNELLKNQMNNIINNVNKQEEYFLNKNKSSEDKNNKLDDREGRSKVQKVGIVQPEPLKVHQEKNNVSKPEHKSKPVQITKSSSGNGTNSTANTSTNNTDSNSGSNGNNKGFFKKKEETEIESQKK